MRKVQHIEVAGLMLLGIAMTVAAQDASVLNIGSRLEPFVDAFLIDRMEGASLRLQEPVPGETVLKFDNPWEGRFCGYVTIIEDGGRYHMYFRGLPSAGKDGSDIETTCYAVSTDGVHFEKPKLGLFEVNGTRDNNVILANAAPCSHNFAPFLDARPGVPPEERFKAVGGDDKAGLIAFVSPDGVHWKKLRDAPIITKGAFDSQNVVFWSEMEGCYCCYFRTWTETQFGGFRSVGRTTSPDFLTWSEPVEMGFGDTPREHLYTNQTRPYFRAPHVYISICARLMPGRRVITAEQMAALGGDPSYSGDCSDAVFFTSRGGNRYDRTFMEGFVRPGIGYENWTSRTNYPVYGLVPVGTSAMSFYIQRNYGQDSAHVQRMTLRLDGFVSVHAPYAGGQMVTKPLQFAGKQLVLNYSTSAAGSVKVEIQDAAGAPIAGFSQAEADDIIGDEIARTVSWKGNSDVSALAGKAVRLHFIMKDGDVFSLRFT